MPRASACVTGSPLKKHNTKSPDAPVYLCVFRVSSEAMIYENDDGSCLFPNINEFGIEVYMISVSHVNAYPAIDFKLSERFDDFLRVKNADDLNLPQS